MTRRTIDGDERDVVSARDLLAVYRHAGVASRVKRRMRRRERHEARTMVRDEVGAVSADVTDLAEARAAYPAGWTRRFRQIVAEPVASGDTRASDAKVLPMWPESSTRPVGLEDGAA